MGKTKCFILRVMPPPTELLNFGSRVVLDFCFYLPPQSGTLCWAHPYTLWRWLWWPERTLFLERSIIETFELVFRWAYWTYVWILIVHNDILKIHIKENEESTVNEGWMEDKLGIPPDFSCRNRAFHGTDAKLKWLDFKAHSSWECDGLRAEVTETKGVDVIRL